RPRGRPPVLKRVDANHFQGKKVTVVGMGRSGIASANLLFDLGAVVSLTEISDNASTRRAAAKLKSSAIKVELGRHTPEMINQAGLVVVSPGVADSALPLIRAVERDIPILNEIELGWLVCPAAIIATTGTNGKTTVATLIGKALEKNGERVWTCGNIGNPFCGEVEKMRAGDFVSLEVSSFQLERISGFKPKIALILNFSRNHLDRYRGMEEYLEAKKRIFKNQDKSDFLVLNSADEALKGLAGGTKAKVVFFSQSKEFNPNQAAVLAVAEVLGIERKLVLEVFREFKGVEHRLEQVTLINQVRFINDSKATTVDSTAWALKNTAGPLILIAGGREIGNDYSIILGLAREKVKEAILIGEASGRIKQAFSGLFPVSEAATVEDAVRMAFSKSSRADTVLFSPMCKSFDMFANFEERGKAFKQAVYNLR
ncbi:MAG: Mur ligase family protein, partial [Candidatus Omnitrophota bacterium]|nr:Mur ligase family protein [Candidatus Omnitrophota bacterium]